MATRKKAKVKTKAKRKKARVAKPARRKVKAVAKRRTPAKRVKKPPAPRASPKKAKVAAKAAAKRPVPAKPAAKPPAQPSPPGERIGVVTHYYSHLSVATVRLESGTLRVGDMIHIRGHTTDFSQKVDSLEVDHAPVTEAGPHDDFGLKVIEHAREHDIVYKVRP